MDIHFSLCLPRDGTTVPMVRHLAKHALWELNVSRQCVGDVELAVTEACANVIDHAGADDEYLVEIDIDGATCAIRVVDDGQGFDFRSLDDLAGEADVDSARGRGVMLMRSLVDSVQLRSEPEIGTVVHLTKQLVFDGNGPPFLRADAAATLPRPATHG